MKTTYSMIAGVMLSFATAGAAYADSGVHNPNQFPPNQVEKGQTAPASQADKADSKVNSASQSSTATTSESGINAGQPAPMHGGYNQHNHSGSITEKH